MKPGDRVRYIAGNSHANPDRIGRLGTVVRPHGKERTHVRWDDGKGGAFPWTCNLEKINMIDTTKPLIVTNSVDDRADVNFITMTSEGHILVDIKPGGPLQKGWFIFNTNGEFVRSYDGSGSKLKLSEKNRETKLYVDLSIYSGDDALRIDTKPGGGAGVANIELTFKDGILTNARVHRANELPFKKVFTRGAGVDSRTVDIA